MTTLQAIQQQMLQAVLAGKTPPLPHIRSDALADAGSRLTVYRHGYRMRLRDALKNEFVGLQCMAGRGFNALLDAYVKAHPSSHYNIRWLGTNLAAFLDETKRDHPQLVEMARLDWAISTAFDAADEPCIGTAELAAIAPEAWANLRFLLQANLQILTATHNIDAFRRAADRGTARPHLRPYAKPRRTLVWRHATTVHYRRLDDDEWQVLVAAQRSEPFAKLCATLAERHGESAAMTRMVPLLRTWLDTGLIRALQT